MSNTFKVELVKTSADANSVVDFFLKDGVFEQVWAPGKKDVLRNSVKQSLKSNKHQYFCVTDGQKIIGAIGIKENSYQSGGFEMAVDYFAVDKEYRRLGIGTLLLNAAEEFAESCKGRYIHILSCDTKTYEPSRKFYIRNRYKKVGYIPDYYVVGEGRVDYFKKLT